MTTITLYHATPLDNLDAIKESGFLTGCDGVYFSNDKDVAANYAFNNSEDIAVFKIEVDYSDLTFDSEFCGNDEDGDFLGESLRNGSCLIIDDVSIENAQITVMN